eukprot:scaffold270751_cov40-Tisochrysis_lutea.AAC.1
MEKDGFQLTWDEGLDEVVFGAQLKEVNSGQCWRGKLKQEEGIYLMGRTAPGVSPFSREEKRACKKREQRARAREGAGRERSAASRWGEARVPTPPAWHIARRAHLYWPDAVQACLHRARLRERLPLPHLRRDLPRYELRLQHPPACHSEGTEIYTPRVPCCT